MAKDSEVIKETTAISIVEPIASTDKLVEAMRRFEDLKQKILSEEDYQKIWVSVKGPDGASRREERKFMVKSAFRKFALAFGLSNRLIDEQRVERPDGSFMWKIKVESIAPNGRTSVGVAACDSRERGWAHLEHDVYSTAFTRALNRAISDMVVGGAVSAEEVEAPEVTEKPERGRIPQPAASDIGQGHVSPPKPVNGSSPEQKPPSTMRKVLEGRDPEEADETWPPPAQGPTPVKGHLSENKLGALESPPRTPQSRSCTANQRAMITAMCRNYKKEFGYDPMPNILEKNEAGNLEILTFEQAEEAIKWLEKLTEKPRPTDKDYHKLI